MAKICHTETQKKWDSSINNSPEGKLKINPEDSDGVFTGRHEGKSKDLVGRCFEAGGGQPHRIWFVVPATNHLYMGKFVNNDSISGHRFLIDVDTMSVHKEAANKREALADDWTAERPT
jgi:hypothetical protein